MLKVGIVGVRGLSTIEGFHAMEDVEVTALCDLDAVLLLRSQSGEIAWC
jgi:hypothetical protein